MAYPEGERFGHSHDALKLVVHENLSFVTSFFFLINKTFHHRLILTQYGGLVSCEHTLYPVAEVPIHAVGQRMFSSADFLRNGVNYSHVLLLWAPVYRFSVIQTIFPETNWVNTRVFVSLLWTISGGTGDGKYMGGETYNEIVIFVMKKLCYEFCHKKKSYVACAGRLFSLRKQVKILNVFCATSKRINVNNGFRYLEDFVTAKIVPNTKRTHLHT